MSSQMTERSNLAMMISMQNLSSDRRRAQMDENNAAMNALADDNKSIVDLLASRVLQAIKPRSHPSKGQKVTHEELARRKRTLNTDGR